jgi:hypothetical protein
MQVDPQNLAAASKITAANVIRQIVSCVLVNFAHDTTNFTDGTWSNETANVLAISTDVGIPPPQEGAANVGQSQAAQMQISFRNPNGRFSPNRTDGANYANVRMDGGGNNRGIYQTPICWWQGFINPLAQSAGLIAAGIPNATDTSFTITLQTYSVGQIISVLGNGFGETTEQMLVTMVSGTTYTVVRGINSTIAQLHSHDSLVDVVGGLVRIFTGVIHSPTEVSRGYSVSYECLDRSYLLMQNKSVTTVSQNVLANTFITTILGTLPSSPTYAPVPSAQRVLDTGIFPLQFAFMDDESGWEEASKVASSDGGYLWFSPRGKLRYWNPQHLLLAEPDTDSDSDSHTASQYTIDEKNMADLSLDYDYDTIYSEVLVQYSPRQIAPLQAVYASNELIIIPPSSTFSTVLRFNYPAINVVQPVGGALAASTNDTRDFVAITAGGVDITSSVTVTAFTAYGARALITFSNANTNYSACIARIQVRGNPLMGGPIKEISATNATIPSDIPARTKTISENWFVQSESQATALAQFVADRYKTARASMGLSGVAGCPLFECGDKVTISDDTALSSDKTAFIMKINARVDGIDGGKQRFVMDVTPMDAASLFQQSNGANYFIVGTDALTNSKVYWY